MLLGWPGASDTDRLACIFKHEQVDLLVLKRIFEATPQAALETTARTTPTASRVRGAWFLYAALTSRTLDASDVPRIVAVD